MAAEVTIALPEGERVLTADELPVLLGSGTGAHIRLPGPATAPPAASINLLDERALVQCYAGISGLQLNGDAITGAQWLREGDRLSVAGVEVSVENIAPESLRLRVSYLARAWDTRPPELAEDRDTKAAIPVRPARSGQGAVQPQGARPWLRVFVGTMLAVLGACALFVFTADGVLIEVEPADAEVRG